MLNLIAAAMFFTSSAVAIDDNLAGGYGGLYNSVSNSEFGQAWSGFWANWWGNATASFGKFTPIPHNGGGYPWHLQH